VPNYASYHLLFLGLKDPKFTYECNLDDEETEEDIDAEDAEDQEDESEKFEDDPVAENDSEDEETEEEEVDEELEYTASEPPASGQGWIGCLVAVSLVAPVALLKFDAFETFETGDYSSPELVHTTQNDGDKEEEVVEYVRTAWAKRPCAPCMRSGANPLRPALLPHRAAPALRRLQTAPLAGARSGR